MAVSGSVALELMYHEKPATILYRIKLPRLANPGPVSASKVHLLGQPVGRGRSPSAGTPVAPVWTMTRMLSIPSFLPTETLLRRSRRGSSGGFLDPQERSACVAKLRILKQSNMPHPGAAEPRRRNHPRPHPARGGVSPPPGLPSAAIDLPRKLAAPALETPQLAGEKPHCSKR